MPREAQLVQPPSDAPIDLAVDPGWQLVLGGAQIVLATVVVYLAMRRPVRERNWRELRFRVLVLLGGALSSITFEPAVDRVTKIWWATQGGPWPLAEVAGLSIPLWVLGVYLWWFGGGTLYMVLQIREGAPPRFYLKFLGAVTIAQVLLEVPILRFAHAYVYYGNQPLGDGHFWPLPVWNMTSPWLLMIPPAIVIVGLLSLPERGQSYLIPAVVPACYLGAYGFAIAPTVWALHSDVSNLERHLAGVVTVLLGVGLTALAISICGRLRDVVHPSHGLIDLGSGNRDGDARSQRRQTSEVTAP
jgi:hypothetical protein